MKILSQKTIGYTMGYYFWVMFGLVVVIESRINSYLQWSGYDPRGYKGSRIQGVEWNAKELQRFKGIEKGVLGRLKKGIAEIERMLMALIKSLENKPLNPWPLESLDPLLQLKGRRALFLLQIFIQWL